MTNYIPEDIKILAYGLSPTELGVLIKNIKNYMIKNIDDWRDILGVPADLVIANLSEMEPNEREVVASFYKDTEPNPVNLIITHPADEFEGIKGVHLVNDIPKDMTRMILLISECADSKRRVDYLSHQLTQMIRIQRQICNKPGVSISELCLTFDISGEEVEDSVDLLKASGAIIKEDRERLTCEMAIWDPYNY